MTKADFEAAIAEARKRDDQILALKNKDYAGGTDYLANINEAAKDLGLSTTQVVAIHLRKQFSALMRWVRDGSLAGESVESRLSDIRNYCMMLEALLAEEKRLRGFWGYTDAIAKDHVLLGKEGVFTSGRVRDVAPDTTYSDVSFVNAREGREPR